MDTVPEVVAAGRDREGTLLAVPGRTTDYGYADFCTSVWKTGNLLRHYGVRAGAAVAVAVGPKEAGPDDEPGWVDAADPLLAVLGAAQLGATVDLAPPEAVDARAFVCPDGWTDRYDPQPGTSVVAYGGPPAEPGVVHFEEERWSENPTRPPDPPSATDPLLGEYTHGTLCAAAERVVEEYGIAAGDRVALGAPLAGTDLDPAGLVAGGVLAPMSVGATVVGGRGDDRAADLVVGPDRNLDPAAVLD